MKFNVAGKALHDQLSAVSKVINAKNTLSILDNFLLSVKDNVLTVVGSDQENEIVAKLEVFESQEDGAVAVNARNFLDLVKEVASQPLSISVDDSSFTVRVEYLTGYYDFIGIDPTEFPVKNESAEELVASFQLPAKEVQRGLEMTLYAVSSESIRPMMTGVFWDIQEDKTTFVSSDTHKLVRYINTMASPGVTTSFILPAKPANILKSLMVKDDVDVKIDVWTNGATFTFADFKITCQFIKGRYPDYNRVIPADNPFYLTANRQELLAAMRRASLFASSASSLVRLEISANDIKITGQDIDYSRLAEDTVNCEYHGNPMTIGFNALYCQQVLSNMTCDEVKVELSNPARPGVFMPLEQLADENLIAIQMPMQVID